MTDQLMSLEEVQAAEDCDWAMDYWKWRDSLFKTARAAHEWKEKYEAMSKCYAIAGHQALVLQEENSKLREQLSAARSLVKALDGAFISSWQSTAAWQTELDECRRALGETESERNDMSEEKKVFQAQITSIKYLAGELTLQVSDDGEVPQEYESGDVVVIEEYKRRTSGEPVAWISGEVAADLRDMLGPNDTVWIKEVIFRKTKFSNYDKAIYLAPPPLELPNAMEIREILWESNENCWDIETTANAVLELLKKGK